MSNLPAKPQKGLITPEDLTIDIVKRYINQYVTDQEAMFFLQLCKAQNLNPFLREAHLIKYSPNEPATMVVGKETFLKRAVKIQGYKGFRAGVVVINLSGEAEYREGALVIEGEKLIGGWAEVYIQDKANVKSIVSMSEYVRKKRDGTPNRSWAEMPATMIRKVALVQALREAFPEEFGGMYSPEEMPIDTSNIPGFDTPDSEITISAPKMKVGEPIELPKAKAEPVVPEVAPQAPKQAGATEKEITLDETQKELIEKLLFLYEGNMEKALDRLEAETTFTSKRDGRLVKGTRDISKLKPTSCHIIIRRIQAEIDRKNNYELPTIDVNEE